MCLGRLWLLSGPHRMLVSIASDVTLDAEIAGMHRESLGTNGYI